MAAAALAQVAAGLPWPDRIFYPPDPAVGDVEPASVAQLAKRLAGRRALVVGGTDGIGKATALRLARAGSDVTVVGHSPAKAADTVQQMRLAAARPGQRFGSYLADLLTVEGCFNLTGRIKAAGFGFDLAVLTVGIWPDRSQPLSADGLDKVLALDVLARFLITRELLPLFSPGGRVLSVLGSTVKIPPAPDAQTIKEIATGQRKKYGLSEILGAAGVLGDAWMARLATLLRPNVTLIGTWPGVVGDGLVMHSKTFPWWLRPFLAAGDRIVGMPVNRSGEIHAQILSSPNAVRRPVTYFNVKMEGRLTNPLASDAGFREWVWSFLTTFVHNHSRF